MSAPRPPFRGARRLGFVARRTDMTPCAASPTTR